jgi:glutamine synthetase
MAKWKREQQGQSGHTHLSLQDLNGKPLFFDANAPQNISDTMRHFIAGQQKLMPEFLAMVTPNVNSFARLVPGYWAPTYASWGIDNRTCALRAILGSAKSQRVEYRIPGADANPYLTLAAALASGLYGIEHKLEPSEPVTGNAYQQTPGDVAQCLPTDLASAAARLRQSQAAREFFGDLFVDDYATTREWEAREAQRHVTDWQLERYFELA